MDGVGIRIWGSKAAGEDAEDGDRVSGGEPALDRKRERECGVVAVRREDEDVQRSTPDVGVDAAPKEVYGPGCDLRRNDGCGQALGDAKSPG